MSNNEDSKPLIGCFIVLLSIILVPILIEFVKSLIPLAFIGLIGYCIYQLQQYDRKTNTITELFEKTFNVNKYGNNNRQNTINLIENKNDTYGLPEPSKSNKEEIDTLRNELEQLKMEKRITLESNEKEFQRLSKKLSKKSKKNLMKKVFKKKEKKRYKQSDPFEEQSFYQKKKRIEDELNFRKLELDVHQNMFEQEKRTLEFRYEAKDDRAKIRAEVQERIQYLEGEYQNLKGLVIEKFHYLDARITKEISWVKNTIADLKVELKEEISSFKVQVGREFVRIDQQMLKVIGKLQECETKVEKFTQQVRKIKVDAERFQLRGERMLNQAQTLYQRHQSEMKSISKDMDVALQKIAVHKGDFANKTASAKLLLDKVSLEHYHSLKEIAHEKVGVNLLRSDHQNRVAASEAKMNQLISEQRHIQEKIQMNQNNFEKVAALRHRLYVNQESLNHARNQNSIMRQEQITFRRLSK